jgi:hypothetical protein
MTVLWYILLFFAICLIVLFALPLLILLVIGYAVIFLAMLVI